MAAPYRACIRSAHVAISQDLANFEGAPQSSFETKLLETNNLPNRRNLVPHLPFLSAEAAHAWSAYLDFPKRGSKSPAKRNAVCADFAPPRKTKSGFWKDYCDGDS